MSETEATIPDAVWLHTLLHKLVCGEQAGIASDDLGQRCVYCSWKSEDYEAAPRHEPTCPIVLGRAALKARRT